jgi:serine/threonine protein kinase
MNPTEAMAEALFAEAVELGAGPARARFITERCAQDAALRRELESLLAAHDGAGGFLETPPPREEAPPSFPGYRLGRKLGQGSLGSVYEAADEKLSRKVAIKLLHGVSSGYAQRRALDEARKAATVAHPNLVTLYSVLDESSPPAIVMEWVEGFPIDRFAGQLSFEQKAHLLREVARGLAAAHEHGLVHRDLKPDNVLVGPDLRPKILDFGLALSSEEASHPGKGFEGTPLYASPEQAEGKPLAASSDMFSFGSLMFKVLTGRVPFEGKTVPEVLRAISSGAPPFLRDVAVGVPEDLQAICLACLSLRPQDRPTASQAALELGRFLVGEPVRLKPKLYGDLLRQNISEYSNRTQAWESQSMISREEHDALETVHRRLLADEDHWIIDARRITLLQTLLSGATWLAVVAAILVVWMLRHDLTPLWRWAVPTLIASVLFGAGAYARKEREPLAAATFLAGGTLALAPCVLAWLAGWHLLAAAPPDVAQLFPEDFTNQQVLASSMVALAASAICLWRLKMTGFAWTTAALTVTSWTSFLFLFNWLKQKPEVQAFWCLPLLAAEPVAVALEKRGRVRWTLPFHLVALATLVGCLDIIALNGPTLKLLGVTAERWAYFDPDRVSAFSFVLNGVVFLLLMLAAEKSSSLDLRRATKLFEVLAIVHTLSALFVNAMNHRGSTHVRADVWLYLAAALLFLALAPFRSRWRLLAGGLVGCGLGSYLLVELDIVARKPFILGLGLAGLAGALATFFYVRCKSRSISR